VGYFDYGVLLLAPLEDWYRVENFTLEEKTAGVPGNRIVFQTLDDLAAYADAFAVVVGVLEISQEAGNMQTAIARSNGAFIRDDMDSGGELIIYGGSGSFPYK
jgi:hypothetical protein